MQPYELGDVNATLVGRLQRLSIRTDVLQTLTYANSLHEFQKIAMQQRDECERL